MADTMNVLAAACAHGDEEIVAYLFEKKIEVTESIIDCYTELIGNVLNR